MYQDLLEPALGCAFALSRACQIVIGECVSAAHMLDFETAMDLFADVPGPATYAEALIAAAIMMRFTRRLGEELHRFAHGERDDWNCAFQSDQYVSPGSVDGHAPETWSAGTVIAGWHARYWSALVSTHPRALTVHVQRRLESEVGQPPSVREIASELGCSVAVLHRRFAEGSGESIGRCRTRARLAAAFDHLRRTDWKVEAIAQEVGWRSKKDLYKAFSDYLGVTPAVVRSMPAGGANELRARLRSRPAIDRRLIKGTDVAQELEGFARRRQATRLDGSLPACVESLRDRSTADPTVAP